jgi:radical SAM protein with 4Fe4S-binding SPASM domain
MDGIQRLHGNGIRIGLKSVLMDANRNDFHRIETMAGEMGVYFRFDAGIIPRLNGDLRPTLHRLNPGEAVDREFQNPARARAWAEFWANRIPSPPLEKQYICGAGKKSFHITANGILRPCMMVMDPSCDLGAVSFADGWTRHLVSIDNQTLPLQSPCRNCDLIDLCGYCPPLFQLENNSENL